MYLYRCTKCNMIYTDGMFEYKTYYNHALDFIDNSTPYNVLQNHQCYFEFETRSRHILSKAVTTYNCRMKILTITRKTTNTSNMWLKRLSTWRRGGNGHDSRSDSVIIIYASRECLQYFMSLSTLMFTRRIGYLIA